MKFIYNDKEYDIILERKNNKNLYIKVSNDLKIKITYPFFYTKSMIEKIVNTNYKSIGKMIDKQINKTVINYEGYFLGKKIDIVFDKSYSFDSNDNILYIESEKNLELWYKNMSKEIFTERLKIIYNLFEEDIPFPVLKIRRMKTRWGVCNRKNISVTLNLDLIKRDLKYIDYVIVHELSHFVYFDHSKNFWNQVSKYCPDYKIIRKELK